MDGKLGVEVGEGEEPVSIVEAALILAGAALHLAIVARRVRADELVSDALAGSSLFKERDQLAVRLGEAIGKFKAVVRLNALDGETLLFEESICLLQKVGGRIDALFLVGRQIQQSRELIDGGVLG